tara:strand:- start:939 stop:1202 length:264 start_codon:yes stop_codon:yes gene_type:complete
MLRDKEKAAINKTVRWAKTFNVAVCSYSIAFLARPDDRCFTIPLMNEMMDYAACALAMERTKGNVKRQKGDKVLEWGSNCDRGGKGL